MFIKRKKQSGIMLMELILAAVILAVFLVGVAVLMQKKERMIKNESTSAYMNTLLDASLTYVSDNFPIVANTITTNNGHASIAIDTDLIANGYLPASFTNNQSPYGETAEIRALAKEGKIHIIILHPPVIRMKAIDSAQIASLVANGRGGTYFGNTAPMNPCGAGLACIQGTLGLWTYDEDEALTTAFVGSLPLGQQTATVAYKKIEGGSEPYLYRKRVWDNLTANTMYTDLNIQNVDGDGAEGTASIFFNATPNATSGDFEEGVQLLYSPGVGVEDTADEDGDGDTTEIINVTSPTLELVDNSSHGLGRPIISSEGGLSTGLDLFRDSVSGEYPSGCIAGQIALNERSEFMQCVNNAWSTVAQDLVRTATSLGDVPATASATLVTIQRSSTGELFQVLIPRGDAIPPAGYTVDAVIGYVE